jgi:hypothetical protein
LNFFFEFFQGISLSITPVYEELSSVVLVSLFLKQKIFENNNIFEENDLVLIGGADGTLKV